MKHIILALTAALAALSFTACSDDDNDAVSKSNASVGGIVLLYVPTEVVAGDTATIRFRVNPSSAPITKDNISLDCYEPNVYEMQKSHLEKVYVGDTVPTELVMARASYVTPSESYTIVELLNDSADGKPLDGQYVLRVAAQSERNIFDLSQWTLVCTSPDANGDTANVSSQLFPLKQIPQPKDGLFAWSPQAVNFRTGTMHMTSPGNVFIDSVTVNGSKWVITPRTYVNATTGGTMTYDYDTYVHDVTPVLLQDTTALTTTKQELTWGDLDEANGSHSFTAIPDTTVAPFSSYEADGDTNFVTLTNVLAVTDKYGHVSIWSQPMTYVLATKLYVDMPVPDPVVAGTYQLDDPQGYMKEHYGVDIDIIQRYPLLHRQDKVATFSSEMAMYAFPSMKKNNFIYDNFILAAGHNKEVAPDVLFRNIFLTTELYGVSKTDVYLKFQQIFRRAEQQ